MVSKLPPEAFNYYVDLGVARSYTKVAERYGVAKRTVVRCAKREGWSARLSDMEAKSREKLAEQAQSSLDEINAQHLKALKFVRARAVEALRSLPLTTSMEAVRALDLCIKNERVILGEPSERSAVTVEDTIKREYERWMLPADSAASRGHDSHES